MAIISQKFSQKGQQLRTLSLNTVKRLKHKLENALDGKEGKQQKGAEKVQRKGENTSLSKSEEKTHQANNPSAPGADGGGNNCWRLGALYLGGSWASGLLYGVWVFAQGAGLETAIGAAAFGVLSVQMALVLACLPLVGVGIGVLTGWVLLDWLKGGKREWL